jgi:hypothetical protein
MNPEKQHIRSKIIIEVLGKPKEHVEETIRNYVKKIEQDPDLIVLKKEFAETKQQDKLWSTFVELEIVAKGVPKLIGFCFDYMPSSIEILKPDELTLSSKSIADFLNDLQARLHSLDMIVKQLRSENTFLKRNMCNVFENIILVTLAKSRLNKEQLSKVTGIDEKGLETFLNKLLEKGLIKKEEGLYSLEKNEQPQK